MCIVSVLYDQYMIWHRKHRGRLCVCYFFVAGWGIASLNKLDGLRAGYDNDFSPLLAMSAWYVVLSSSVILFDLFYRMPHFVPMVAWGFFASGMLFWATVATSNSLLFALSGCAGAWQVWVLSGKRQTHTYRKKRL